MLDIAQARGTLSSFFGSMKRRHQDRKQYAELRHNPVIHIHLGYQRYKSWKQFLDHAYWSVELK